MSRNGSGTYTLPAGNPVVTGTTITTTWANTTLSDIASSLTGSVAADGQTPMSGSLNMANNKIIAVLDPTLAQDAATKAYVDTADALALLKANNLSDVANATTSRTNLIAAKSGANSDITSITGLTTALSVGQGGTGLTAPGTSGNILTSNGTIWTSTAASSNYVGAKGQVFTANGTFTIPANITALKIIVTGGGGGGAGSGGNGGAGGNSTVASGTQTITTLTGGGGAGGAFPTSAGGTATNGDINIKGGPVATGGGGSIWQTMAFSGAAGGCAGAGRRLAGQHGAGVGPARSDR